MQPAVRLKVLAAVDCRMARQEVADTRETLEEAIPDAHSLVKLEYVGDGFRTAATNHRINTQEDRSQLASAASQRSLHG